LKLKLKAMERGYNTNNTLRELELIKFQMKNGGFDYDGVIPESALEDVEEDIEILIESKLEKNCITEDKEHFWINNERKGCFYCLYCQKEI